jgi:hypothetical protein
MYPTSVITMTTRLVAIIVDYVSYPSYPILFVDAIYSQHFILSLNKAHTVKNICVLVHIIISINLGDVTFSLTGLVCYRLAAFSMAAVR